MEVGWFFIITCQLVLSHAVLRPTDKWRGSKAAIIGRLKGEERSGSAERCNMSFDR